MLRLGRLSPSRRMTLTGLFFWAVGGACFLTGFRVGADLALGIALTLFAAAILPLPRGGD